MHVRQYEGKTFPVLMSHLSAVICLEVCGGIFWGKIRTVFLGKEWKSLERVTLEWKYKGRATHGKYGGRHAKLLDGMNIAFGLEYYSLQETFSTLNVWVVIRLVEDMQSY